MIALLTHPACDPGRPPATRGGLALDPQRGRPAAAGKGEGSSKGPKKKQK
jgi:hypothetical protein